MVQSRPSVNGDGAFVSTAPQGVDVTVGTGGTVARETEGVSEGGDGLSWLEGHETEGRGLQRRKGLGS